MDILKVFTNLTALVILLSQIVLGYSVETDITKGSPTHQYISNESGYVWVLIPYEMKVYLNTSLTEELDKRGYNPGEKIIVGSGEEDRDPIIILPPQLLHFWDPDYPEVPFDFDPASYNKGISIFKSSFRRTTDELWNESVCLKVTGGYQKSCYNHFERLRKA